jgi:hypothetical protein
MLKERPGIACMYSTLYNLNFEHFILGDLNAVYHTDVDIIFQRNLSVSCHVCFLEYVCQS